MAEIDDSTGGHRPELRLSEVAEILGISTRTAYRRAHAGALPIVHGPAGMYVPRDALAAYLAIKSDEAMGNLKPAAERADD